MLYFYFKKNQIIIFQLLKFGFVGIIGSLTNYFIFFLLFYFGSIHYLISGLMGFLLPVPIIFYFNKKWTFNSKVSSIYGLPSYLLICIFGLIGHTGVLFLLTELYKIDPLISQVPAIMTSASINFILAKFIVFKTS